MKIFYSWQSELKRKVTRDIIMSALKIAVQQIESEAMVEEAARNEIEIDHDTKGVLGNPSVADTIFKKIDNCSVFLADVSIVHTRANGNGSINSNVAIELGYGYGKHGDGISILVMNEAFGKANNLPFDLVHRRHPLLFNLNESASKNEIDKTTEALAKQLKVVLKEYEKVKLAEKAKESIDEFKVWLTRTVGQNHAEKFLSNPRQVIDIAINAATAEEMFKFKEAGQISVQNTGSQMSLGAGGGSIGNSIKDKVRPYGMGSIFRVSHPIGGISFL